MQIKKGYFIGISFLQDNSLTTRRLVDNVDDSENLSVMLGDFTEEGLLFYRTDYQKYWKALDRGTDPEISKKRILEKRLKDLRA